MKKQLSIVFVLLASIFYAISYASENAVNKETIYNLTEVDTRPRVIKAVQPSYPPNQITLDGVIIYEGRVTLNFVITKDGNVRNPEVVKSIPEGIFDKSALEAIKKYRFKPATKNGEPVNCNAGLNIEFKMPHIETSYDAYKASEKGLRYFKAGEYEKAIKAYTEAIKINKKYSSGYSGRGITYIELGEYKKAISDMNKAIKLDPEISLYYRVRGHVYKELEEYQKALKDYGNAINIEPDMIEDYFNRGEILRKLEEYEEAIKDYTRVIELDESYVQAYNNRAVSYNKLKDAENMCLDLKKACELGDCRGFDYAKEAGKCTDDAANTRITD